MLSVLQLSTGAWPVLLRGDGLVGDAAASSEPAYRHLGERPYAVGAGQGLGHSLWPIIGAQYSASRLGLDLLRRSGLEGAVFVLGDRHSSH